MNRKIGLPVLIFAVAAAAAAGFGACWALWWGRFDAGDRLIAEAKSKIETEFVGQYDKTTLGQGAVAGMVSALGDRWSYYLNPEEFKAHQDALNNTYVGIGVTVELDQAAGGLRITKVQASSSAEKAGLAAGDYILAADGTKFKDLDFSKIKALILGEAGTSVALTVKTPAGETKAVTLVRSAINVIPVTYTMLDGKTGYVKLSNFDKTAGDYLISAVDALKQQGAKALVFDVRNNPGGMLTELLKALDYLLPEGNTFISKDYTGAETVYTSDAACVDLPIAVLVNGDSYSAAEFFAAALQESGRGVVVGVKTFGKGYSQTPVMLSDGSAIMLSTAAYYTGKHVSLIGTGVTPDIAVSLSDQDTALLLAEGLPYASDAQLRKAIEATQKS